MLTNPLLKDMSTEDLNQRFGHSYIHYGEEIVAVEDFIRDDEGVVMIGTTDSTHPGLRAKVPKYTAFRWELVDCTRPEAQWYLFSEGARKVAGYYSSVSAKQYSRGFSRNNCYITRVFDLHPLGICINTMEVVFQEPRARRTKIRLHWEDALNQLKTQDLVLQANLAVIKLGDTNAIMWRRLQIGKLLPDGLVEIIHHHFKDEIQESFPTVRFVPHKYEYTEDTDEVQPYRLHQWQADILKKAKIIRAPGELQPPFPRDHFAQVAADPDNPPPNPFEEDGLPDFLEEEIVDNDEEQENDDPN